MDKLSPPFRWFVYVLLFLVWCWFVDTALGAGRIEPAAINWGTGAGRDYRPAVHHCINNDSVEIWNCIRRKEQ